MVGRLSVSAVSGLAHLALQGVALNYSVPPMLPTIYQTHRLFDGFGGTTLTPFIIVPSSTKQNDQTLMSLLRFWSNNDTKPCFLTVGMKTQPLQIIF